jgi:hypothetical protein
VGGKYVLAFVFFFVYCCRVLSHTKNLMRGGWGFFKHLLARPSAFASAAFCGFGRRRINLQEEVGHQSTTHGKRIE